MSINLRLSSSPNGIRNTLSKNIVADYSADNTGVNDCAPSFNSFRTDMSGQTSPVTLRAPAGSYTFRTNAAQFFTNNVRNLRFYGDGIDVTNISRVEPSSASLQFGASGLFFDNLHSARVNTCAAGDTVVSLVDATKAGRFSVGQRCLFAGFDLQGYGDPFNNHFFEFPTIIDIQTIGGIVYITFSSPLKYGYKSTWPVYNDGSNYATGGGMDQAGAATLFALGTVGDCSITVQDMTLIAGSGVGDPVAYIQGRSTLLKSVKSSAAFGLSPTVAETAIVEDIDFSGQIEFDKSIDLLQVKGGYLHKAFMQSSSINRCEVSDGALIDHWAGTPKKFFCDSSTITLLQIGPAAHGVTEEVGITNSVISAISGAGSNLSISGWSCSGGVITAPISGNLPVSCAVPDNWVRFLNSSGLTIAVAKVLDVTRDATNCYITTTLAGDFPTGAAFIKDHPCANFSGSNNTGCAEAVEWSLAPAQNKPIYSYVRRTYDKTLLTGSAAPAPISWGLMTATDAMSVDVTTPYTGVQGSLYFRPTQFSNQVRVLRGGSIVTMDMRIDVKVSGKRTYNGVTNTWSGGQPNDILPAFQAGDWLVGTFVSSPTLSANVSGESAGPVFVYEIKSDQGIS